MCVDVLCYALHVYIVCEHCVFTTSEAWLCEALLCVYIVNQLINLKP